MKKFDWSEFFKFQNMIKPLNETIYMVAIATFFALLIGLPIGILLVVTDSKGISPSKKINKLLDIILINITRSIPFIILMVLLIPLSRAIVGRSYGSTAFIVPLAIGAAPFVARIVEGALKEVDYGLIEASISMGASKLEIIFKVLLPEAFTALINGLTLTIITLIGYSAMAGVIGGGGLGNTAIIDGYQKNNKVTMWKSTVVIIILVQIIQFIGNQIVKRRLDRRKKV